MQRCSLLLILTPPFQQHSDWQALHSYLEEMYIAGSLYAAAGSVREAEFYLLRGKELSTKMSAQRVEVRFLLAQAALEYHKRKYAKADELLETV